MINKSSFKSQSGQVAVIVFLIMAVLLVVGLSLATRTSQEIELAGQQEDTTRVFNAAESGIEEALSQESNFGTADGGFSKTLAPNTSTNVTIQPQEGFENTFQPGETATVFTNEINADQGIVIRWAKSGSECSSVLVVTAYYKSGASVQAQHTGIRPVGCTAFSGTQFGESNQGASLGGYLYAHSMSVPPLTTMLRIKPLYAATAIQVDDGTGSLLTEQQHLIRSVAQDSSGSTTEEVRAIEVTRSKPAPPSILDYALYSGGTLKKD